MRYDDNKLRETFQSLSKELIEGELQYNKQIIESVEIINDIAKGKGIIINENISSKNLDSIWGVYKERMKVNSTLDTTIIIQIGITISLELLFLFSLIWRSTEYRYRGNRIEINRTVKKTIERVVEIITIDMDENSNMMKDFGDLKPVLEEELKNLLDEMLKNEK